MYLTVSDQFNAAFNLALEERLFYMLGKEESQVLIWRNSNAVIIGKNQNACAEVNPEALRKYGTELVRRLSGGGAVYHDYGNLNYTVIVPYRGEPYDFHSFSEPVRRALNEYGIEARCGRRNDLLVGERKIGGCAQYIKDGKVLHHGCVLIDADPAKMDEILRIRKKAPEGPEIPSVHSKITWLNSLLQMRVEPEHFAKTLIGEFFTDGGPTVRLPKDCGEEEIRTLVERRYGKREWNWGTPSDRHWKKETYVPEAGLILVEADTGSGRAEHLRISGDFFGIRPIRELEDALEGVSGAEELRRRIDQLDLQSYIRGMSVEEFATLFPPCL
ncbi:MAG: lipoate--protein ligase [Lachnospiraceae bacterium]|nr:lipoate--protein ligase [Lachnospiraceae bacterium]